MTKQLTETELQAALPSIPAWKFEQSALVRVATFADFQQAMRFVNVVADLAERAGHHPDIDIRYSKVRLALVTHDADGITESDINLALDIDKKS